MMIPWPLLLLAAAAVCPTEPRTSAGLRQAEARWVAALEARDGAALACRLSPDFADTNWQGRIVSRDDMLARLPQRPPSRLRLTEITVRLEGATGIVRGLNTQVAPNGTAVGRVRFTDIFVARAPLVGHRGAGNRGGRAAALNGARQKSPIAGTPKAVSPVAHGAAGLPRTILRRSVGSSKCSLFRSSQEITASVAQSSHV